MSDRLLSNQSIAPNGFITSNNGRYTFVYQGDGNLVLYKNYFDGTQAPLWASGTNGRPGQVCVMQGDGNLVLYDGANPIWSTDTWHDPGSWLIVQDDGNVVIYRTDNSAIWATNTVQPPFPPDGPTASGDRMLPGQTLHVNERIISNNRLYTFIYQTDGNLVLYKHYSDGSSQALWASGTNGRIGQVCIMQGDGNLVIYDRNGSAIWSTDTWHDAGSWLIVQDDGNVVIYRPNNSPVWATNTMQRNVPDGPSARGSVMEPGEVLHPNESIISGSGRYTFIFQSDGNLVLYKNYSDGTSKALWASGTDGRPGKVCIMQGDGNLVIYDRDGNALWASDTWHDPGSRVLVQDDGNVVIYRTDWSPVWATNSMQLQSPPDGPTARNGTMNPGEALHPGEFLTSGNGRYMFVYQTDGNLVLYRNLSRGGQKATWSSGTDGRPGQVCIMQADGNLVIYDRDGNPLWSSDTWHDPGSVLFVQDDGNVVIYRPDNSPLWATGTHEERLNLFLIILTEPTSFTRTEMLDEMRYIYGDVGIDVNVRGGETLDLNDPAIAPLDDIDTGSCTGGSPSTEQRNLSDFRNNATANDVVIYFCRSVSKNTGSLNGCASHPVDRPMAVVASYASLYTMAHEVGHVLGLGHVDDNNRLMTENGTGNITNAPPDLIQEEIDTMLESPLTV